MAEERGLRGADAPNIHMPLTLHRSIVSGLLLLPVSPKPFLEVQGLIELYVVVLFSLLLLLSIIPFLEYTLRPRKIVILVSQKVKHF